jgi:hypothetical protein
MHEQLSDYFLKFYCYPHISYTTFLSFSIPLMSEYLWWFYLIKAISGLKMPFEIRHISENTCSLVFLTIYRIIGIEESYMHYEGLWPHEKLRVQN